MAETPQPSTQSRSPWPDSPLFRALGFVSKPGENTSGSGAPTAGTGVPGRQPDLLDKTVKAGKEIFVNPSKVVEGYDDYVASLNPEGRSILDSVWSTMESGTKRSLNPLKDTLLAASGWKSSAALGAALAASDFFPQASWRNISEKSLRQLPGTLLGRYGKYIKNNAVALYQATAQAIANRSLKGFMENWNRHYINNFADAVHDKMLSVSGYGEEIQAQIKKLTPGIATKIWEDKLAQYKLSKPTERSKLPIFMAGNEVKLSEDGNKLAAYPKHPEGKTLIAQSGAARPGAAPQEPKKPDSTSPQSDVAAVQWKHVGDGEKIPLPNLPFALAKGPTPAKQTSTS